MEEGNLNRVKDMWRVYERQGHDAGVDALIDVSHDNAEYRFYATGEEVLHGAEELRAFYRRERTEGMSVRAAAYDYSDDGDTIYVSGWVRVAREGSGHADAQVRWIYEFENGLVKRMIYAPLAAPAPDPVT
ncbi:MAG: nuclear transport factor 2 family protein [Gemmatimonadales bacterium]